MIIQIIEQRMDTPIEKVKNETISKKLLLFKSFPNFRNFIILFYFFE